MFIVLEKYEKLNDIIRILIIMKCIDLIFYAIPNSTL